MNLQSNDFALFNLSPTFAQDRAVVDERWRELQRQVHPDRFTASAGAAPRLAMQWSVRINEAYGRLKDPLRRAAYLCELNGQSIKAETNTAMPGEFLIQQMEWREALDESGALIDIQRLSAEVQQAKADRLAACRDLLDEKHDYAAAAQEVRALMFIARFNEDVEDRLEHLGQ